MSLPCVFYGFVKRDAMHSRLPPFGFVDSRESRLVKNFRFLLIGFVFFKGLHIFIINTKDQKYNIPEKIQVIGQR
jgi:hypothetical protein